MLIILSLAGVACSDSSTDSGSEPATVEGRVEQQESGDALASPTASAAVEGAAITTANVQADGSSQAMTGVSAQSNAQGEFSLVISGEAVANASDHIIVQAEKEGQSWKAFLSSRLEGGSTVRVQPLTVESSGEADVYQRVVADGNTETVTTADIEALVQSQAASEIRGNSSVASQAATALAAHAEARTRAFASMSAEISSEMMSDIREAKQDAQVELENRLHAAAGSSGEADQDFYASLNQAWLDAGAEAGTYAKAEQTATSVLVRQSTQLSAQTRNQMRSRAAYLTALAVDQAVQGRMEAEGAAQSSIDAAAQAGADLRAEIWGNATATQNEVESAFDGYNQAVVGVLQQEFGAQATVIAGINTQINGTGGVKTQLESTVSASSSTETIVDAYVTFYSGVQNAVDAALTSASDAEAEFVAEILILANLGN